MSKRALPKFLILFAIEIAWTVFIAVGGIAQLALVGLAAIPMRLLRRDMGRGPYWVLHLLAGAALIAAGLPLQGLAFLLVTILIGAYAEVESVTSIFTSGLLAVLIAAGVGSAGVAVWLNANGANLMTLLRGELQQYVDYVKQVYPTTTVEMLTQSLPSWLVISMVVALAMALIWERRASVWAGLPWLHHRPRALTEFRIPDVFVWVTIASLLGAFVKTSQPWIEVVSLNVLNVMLMLYFFQGFAIVIRAMDVFRVGPFAQTLWILFFLLFQQVPVVLGFADFWFDFRTRFSKRATEIKKSFQD